jgi:hypothetical protein
MGKSMKKIQKRKPQKGGNSQSKDRQRSGQIKTEKQQSKHGQPPVKSQDKTKQNSTNQPPTEPSPQALKCPVRFCAHQFQSVRQREDHLRKDHSIDRIIIERENQRRSRQKTKELCNECYQVLTHYRYAESNHGPVYICDSCVEVVKERSFPDRVKKDWDVSDLPITQTNPVGFGQRR